MKGNASFYQVNLVSRITGEGGGAEFEGRGGLVLIKSVVLAKMTFDEIFDLTAGVYFNFYNIILIVIRRLRYRERVMCPRSLNRERRTLDDVTGGVSWESPP